MNGHQPKGVEVRLATMIDVHDAVALHAEATRLFMAAGGTEAESEQWLGTSIRPALDACIREVAHRRPCPGTTAVSEDVMIVDPSVPVLRQGVTVHASTGNITAEELDRINAAFDLDPVGNGVHRCLDDITHDGLFLSPKHAGFIVRIPGDDFVDDVVPGLTPQMRALVEAAVRQGASRLEFDADEEYPDGFHEE